MDDRAEVAALLGRPPRGRCEVVVRDADGLAVVVRNDPLLDDGTPMPTRYWLVGPRQVRAVSRLEAAGGVRAAERAVDPAALADAHVRYAAERDAALPDDHHGPRPSGGVGGTRRGVKCLHAHFAWHLAGGDDPVGAWVAAQVGEPAQPAPPENAAARRGATFELGDAATLVRLPSGATATLPFGTTTLHDDVLAGSDPPAPEQLTNALGLVADHLDDVVREHPELIEASPVRVTGEEAWHLAAVDHGQAATAPTHTVERDAAEELFRTLATERRADRLHNPALEATRVDTVLAGCCIVVAVMRELHLGEIELGGAA